MEAKNVLESCETTQFLSESSTGSIHLMYVAKEQGHEDTIKIHMPTTFTGRSDIVRFLNLCAELKEKIDPDFPEEDAHEKMPF